MKILLHVEDCETQRLYFRIKFKKLKLKNARLIQVSTVLEALDILSRYDVNFVVLDYQLPGFNGDSLKNVLKSKGIYAVIFTAVDLIDLPPLDFTIFSKSNDEQALFEVIETFFNQTLEKTRKMSITEFKTISVHR